MSDLPFRLKDRCRRDLSSHIVTAQYQDPIISTKDGIQKIENWKERVNGLPTVEEELNALIKPKNMRKTVYIMHMPPYGVGLDDAGENYKVGSQAIYNFIKTNQPLMTLHGHVHESPVFSAKWFSNIGDTVCIQPGQGDDFRYVKIELDTMKYERIKMSLE